MPLSPNMNLPVSVAGVDSGLTWETNLNASLSIIDQHNHTAGQGVPIPPSGINISADLPFNANNAITLRSTRYTPQPAALSLPTDLGCVYVSGVDLWFNDVNGNQVQLTTGGSVNATSSGISSGTATASFVSTVLVVNAASNTPANIQAGSILLGNNVAASKFLTLSPPLAMAANYGLVLPALPASTKIMALDNAGNISAPYSVDNSTIEISTNTIQVKANGIGTTQLADGSVTEVKLGPANYVVSSSSGSFTTASGTPVDVTNLNITITSTGRPIELFLMPNGSNLSTVRSDTQGAIYFFNVTTSTIEFEFLLSSPTGSTAVPCGGLRGMVFPVAGTYNYKVLAFLSSGAVVGVINCLFVAREV